eukprot:3599251-Pleurochrysis_carterae.AAC.2
MFVATHAKLHEPRPMMQLARTDPTPAHQLLSSTQPLTRTLPFPCTHTLNSLYPHKLPRPHALPTHAFSLARACRSPSRRSSSPSSRWSSPSSPSSSSRRASRVPSPQCPRATAKRATPSRSRAQRLTLRAPTTSEPDARPPNLRGDTGPRYARLTILPCSRALRGERGQDTSLWPHVARRQIRSTRWY